MITVKACARNRACRIQSCRQARCVANGHVVIDSWESPARWPLAQKLAEHFPPVSTVEIHQQQIVLSAYEVGEDGGFVQFIGCRHGIAVELTAAVHPLAGVLQLPPAGLSLHGIEPVVRRAHSEDELTLGVCQIQLAEHARHERSGSALKASERLRKSTGRHQQRSGVDADRLVQSEQRFGQRLDACFEQSNTEDMSGRLSPLHGQSIGVGQHVVQPEANKPIRKHMPFCVLILLPHGLQLGGVTTWAQRLGNELRNSGHEVLLLTPGRAGALKRWALDPERVPAWMRCLGDLPPLETTGGDLTAWLRACEPIVRTACSCGPCIWMPQQLGEGISLGLDMAKRHDLRSVWVNHSDLAYNRLVASSFSGWLDGAVGVSHELGAGLREVIQGSGDDRRTLVRTILNGVPVGDAPPVNNTTGERLRLVAIGRMDHEQKRVLALVHMSRALQDRGVAHELTMVGDGPAMGDVRTLIERLGITSIRLPGSLEPSAVAEVLRGSDVFVQASRYEGLSLSMLEAMAAGVPPVISRVRSGVDGVVLDGINGILADAHPEDPPEVAGQAMADGVQRATEVGIAQLGHAAWQAVHEHFNVRTQAAQYAALFDELVARPHSKLSPPAFFGSAEFGTVPTMAAEAAATLLRRLAGRRIALHGAGAHTRALAAALNLRDLGVVYLLDDDPAMTGVERYGLPVESPSRVSELGISDVVISSWLHQEVIWSRRNLYEAQGVRVHRLYADESEEISGEPGPQPPPSTRCATTNA